MLACIDTCCGPLALVDNFSFEPLLVLGLYQVEDISKSSEKQRAAHVHVASSRKECNAKGHMQPKKMPSSGVHRGGHCGSSALRPKGAGTVPQEVRTSINCIALCR